MMATGILQMKGLTAHVADYKVALENAGKVVQILFSILLKKGWCHNKYHMRIAY